MSLRYDSLPKKLRDQVDAQIGKQATGHRSRAVATEGVTTAWRCTSCGEVMTTEAACDRHPHRRIECLDSNRDAAAVASASQPKPKEGEPA